MWEPALPAMGRSRPWPGYAGHRQQGWLPQGFPRKVDNPENMIMLQEALQQCQTATPKARVR
ncbi:hypothetical protein D3C87_1952900 [compost metagenome]